MLEWVFRSWLWDPYTIHVGLDQVTQESLCDEGRNNKGDLWTQTKDTLRFSSRCDIPWDQVSGFTSGSLPSSCWHSKQLFRISVCVAFLKEGAFPVPNIPGARQSGHLHRDQGTSRLVSIYFRHLNDQKSHVFEAKTNQNALAARDGAPCQGCLGWWPWEMSCHGWNPYRFTLIYHTGLLGIKEMVTFCLRFLVKSQSCLFELRYLALIIRSQRLRCGWTFCADLGGTEW